MNTIVKEALAKVPQLDATAQAEVAAFINEKVAGVYQLSDAELAACEEGLRDSSRGIFASQSDVDDVFAKLHKA